MVECGLRLLADLGGTNARFALAEPGAEPGRVGIFEVARHGTFLGALAAYIEGLGGTQPITSAAIAAAGAVSGGRVALTNAPWEIAEADVSTALSGSPVAILNDLEAVALSLPWLGLGDIETIQPGRALEEKRPLLAFNVGTGLGAAVAVPAAGGWHALATEAGHMQFAAATAAEAGLAPVVDTYEDVLSGPGLARLRERLGTTSREVFSDLLGRIAGDLVLATGSWGGLFLCGGVMADWHRTVDACRFEAAFRRKGPMSSRMAGVPVHLITRPEPAFLGLTHMSLG